MSRMNIIRPHLAQQFKDALSGQPHHPPRDTLSRPWNSCRSHDAERPSAEDEISLIKNLKEVKNGK
jgi:hypothetical protein